MLEALISEKGGRKTLRADLKESSIPEFEHFHKSSFFFGHLLNFSSKFARKMACVYWGLRLLLTTPERVDLIGVWGVLFSMFEYFGVLYSPVCHL
jgi:hypothetical protein